VLLVGRRGLRFEQGERLLCGLEVPGRGLDDARERVAAEIGGQPLDPGPIEGSTHVVEHMARELASQGTSWVPALQVELDADLAHREGPRRDALVGPLPGGPELARDRRHPLEAALPRKAEQGLTREPLGRREALLAGDDAAFHQAPQDREDVVVPGSAAADPLADLAQGAGDGAHRLVIVEHREDLDGCALDQRKSLEHCHGIPGAGGFHGAVLVRKHPRRRKC
jgi:hypothetical protein